MKLNLIIHSRSLALATISYLFQDGRSFGVDHTSMGYPQITISKAAKDSVLAFLIARPARENHDFYFAELPINPEPRNQN